MSSSFSARQCALTSFIEASQILANSSGVALRRGLGSSPAWPNQPFRSRPLNNASNPRGGTGSACSAESVRQKERQTAGNFMPECWRRAGLVLTRFRVEGRESPRIK